MGTSTLIPKGKAKTSFDNFLELVNEETKLSSNYLRNGEILLSILEEIWPEEYFRIRNKYYPNHTNIDCYFDSRLIIRTIHHLRNSWEF